jgi:hypothetical protein
MVDRVLDTLPVWAQWRRKAVQVHAAADPAPPGERDSETDLFEMCGALCPPPSPLPPHTLTKTHTRTHTHTHAHLFDHLRSPSNNQSCCWVVHAVGCAHARALPLSIYVPLG